MQFVPSILTERAQPVTISATPGSPGATIPADFVGLSYEVDSSGLLGGFFDGNATSLAGMIGMLGTSGVIRFGGNESLTAPNLTQGIVDGVNAFLGLIGSGWKVLYGLNLISNDSATATAQAEMLYDTLGGTKVTFQAGNEPIDGSPPDYTVQGFADAYNAYYAAVTAQRPSSKWAAYDDSDFGQAWNAIKRLTPPPSSLAYLSLHYYPWESRDPPDLNNPPQVLAKPRNLSASFISAGAPSVWHLFNYNVPWLTANGIKTRFSETNMMSSGGLDGMTNALANAAWVIGMQMALARAGGAGVNVHGSLNTAGLYDPIYKVSTGIYKAAPVFYGLYLFSRLAGQQMLPISYAGMPTDLDAMATKDGSNVVRMLVVNGRPTSNLSFKPALSGSSWTSATVLKLDGTGFGDKNPTLGGAVIGNGGSWSGAATTISNGSSVTLCPCGAALLTFT